MKKFFHLIIAILLCELVGVIGSFFTMPGLPWYAQLIKPSLNPPSWVFGPVWVVLYFLMGVSLFLVWQQRRKCSVKTPLMIFGVQLVLNGLWSYFFFSLHSFELALLDIIFLWFAILWTIISFSRVSRHAAWLLVPYIFWVSFAVYLSASIWFWNVSLLVNF